MRRDPGVDPGPKVGPDGNPDVDGPGRPDLGSSSNPNQGDIARLREEKVTTVAIFCSFRQETRWVSPAEACLALEVGWELV